MSAATDTGSTSVSMPNSYTTFPETSAVFRATTQLQLTTITYELSYKNFGADHRKAIPAETFVLEYIFRRLSTYAHLNGHLHGFPSQSIDANLAHGVNDQQLESGTENGQIVKQLCQTRFRETYRTHNEFWARRPDT